MKRVAGVFLGRRLRGVLVAMTVLAIAVLAMFVLATGVAEAQSLRDSAQQAVKTNPRLDVVTNNRQAVEQELARARGQYLPQVDLRAGVGPEWSENGTTRARGDNWAYRTRRESGVFVTQRLFDGWETDSEVERQKARGQSAARRVGETSEIVALDAIEAHIDVLRQRELVRLAQDNLEVHRRILGRVRQRAGNGAAPMADVDQARARLENADAILIETRGALEDAENRYEFIVHRRPGALGPAEFPRQALDRASSADAAVERARRQNRTLRITESDVVVAEREIDAADAPFYPRVNLEVGATRNRDIDGAKGDDNDVSALVVMRWNLYRGGSDIAQRRVALGRMSQAMAQRQVAARNAEEEARRSWVQYTTANDRLQPLRNAIDRNRRVRNAYNDQFFNQGQRSLIDVLNAENELFVSRGRLVSADQTRTFSAYRLLAAMGDLVDVLGLEIPAEADEAKPAPVPQDPRPGRAKR
ncbi:MAG: TolC family outer membrane protein [Alphaproteobacteria bacterium]|nr:TolC family outer membrane protein [Alphaproteobacteria bacterium]